MSGWVQPPQPIESAPQEEAFSILASVTGKVWVQASWDEEEQRWITFNRYWEVGFGRRQPGWRFAPRYWMPIPYPLVDEAIVLVGRSLSAAIEGGEA